MPTYEYQCRSCKHRFETWQKMTDEPLTICPECGSSIHRLFFPAGIVFKGSGFYKTDHRSNGASGENGNNHKSNGAESAKESDTKTATESKSGGSGSDSSSTKSGENSVPVEAK
ncbi:MAG TPA: FmdB family zinc ribbon protein [Ktedonobacteraceae bacterium]